MKLNLSIVNFSKIKYLNLVFLVVMTESLSSIINFSN